MDLAKLAAWRAALIRETERMVAPGAPPLDEVSRRRLFWLETQVELIEERIRETVGSAD